MADNHLPFIFVDFLFNWMYTIIIILRRKDMNLQMTILYEIDKKLYINLTNKCPCNCIFCIRNNGDSAYGSDSLWLQHDPSTQEVIAALNEKNLARYDEIIFCGFGEPTEALYTLLEVAKYIKSVTTTPVRINTNGLADLIHGKPTAHLFKDLIDIVSVSLNAGSESEYLRVTQPCFGKISYQAMLDYAVDCKKYVKKVILSIVDILEKNEIKKCKELSETLDIPLRIRKYDE